MKNFLKSTALFACIAMLFCACSEDSMDDTSVEIVDAVSAPEMIAVTPGISNIYVAWNVLKESTADQTEVTWECISGDSTLLGSHTENVIANKDFYVSALTAELTVYDSDTDTSTTADEEVTLFPGDYTVTITNVNSLTGEVSTTQEFVVTVYDDTVYAESYPVPTDITYDIDAEEVTITWGEVHGDCTAVSVIYNSSTKLTFEGVATGDQTVLPGAVAGEAYYYISTFCPEGCEDEVYITSEEDLVLGTNPDAPAWVSFNAGNERLVVRWTYSADSGLTDLDSSVITVSVATEDEYEEGEVIEEITVSVDDLQMNSDDEYYYEIPSIAVGEYSVSVLNIKVGGFYSEETTAVADAVVYNEDSFTAPTFGSIAYNAESGLVDITWDGTTEEVKNIVVEYKDNSGNTQSIVTGIIDSVITTTSLEDAKSGEKLISATAYMRYTNGLDLIAYPVAVSTVTVP